MFVQVIEGMEKFLLRRILSCNKVYIVYQQYVGFSVSFAEFGR